MKTLFLTASHPRHLHIAKRLYDSNMLDGLIIENRGTLSVGTPEGLSDVDRENFIRHFEDREVSENNFFGQIDKEYFKDIPILEIQKQDLNTQSTKNWIEQFNPDVAISYGIHKLNNDMLKAMPKNSFNIHGGLSPWYRGCITLFWPFYFLKPNWAGMTLHYLTENLDGGNIIHHSVPQLEKGDGLHDVACKAVKQVAEDLPKILELIKTQGHLEGTKQSTTGKIFNAEDWKPQHLRLIYNHFNNDIVDRFLDGELGHDEPTLVKVF